MSFEPRVPSATYGGVALFLNCITMMDKPALRVTWGTSHELVHYMHLHMVIVWRVELGNDGFTKVDLDERIIEYVNHFETDVLS